MGCRGNIEISQPKFGFGEGDVSIFLYTHWGGDEVCESLARGLEAGRSRWTDPDYLTRIIFNELQGDDRRTTGFGIGIQQMDNEFEMPNLYWTTRDGKFGSVPDEPFVMYEGSIFTAEEFMLKFLPEVATPNSALEDTQELETI